MTILGVVLAGGESRRFGSDKLAARLGERTLLDHAIDWLRPRTDAVAVCGRTLAGIASLADRPAAGLGPLGGLAAALHYAGTQGHDMVLSIPGDTPDLPEDLFPRLLALGAPVFVRGCPVIGLWPASAAAALAARLAHDDDRSMRGWARTIDAQVLTLPAPIANVNFPADLAALGDGKP
ncbi:MULTISPECIES: molybdenum cofactor guanylyltransferase [unclassified Sphingomonas]|uniref:molybdenum cofactor guanylyltransferase n=1 Tax=unclassified Sphingomonas TaxID=196159 RepID=UPI001F598298|nr:MULTISPECIES: molybdenum cofactor guanylyltransferase [unclassified Sphingomonas]